MPDSGQMSLPPSGATPPPGSVGTEAKGFSIAGKVGTVLAIVGLVVVVVLVRRHFEHTKTIASVTAAPPPAQVGMQKQGISSNPEYQKLTDASNKKAYEKAVKSGGTVVPVFGGTHDVQKVATGSFEPAQPPASRSQDPRAVEQNRRQEESQREQAIQSAMSGMLNVWNNQVGSTVVVVASSANSARGKVVSATATTSGKKGVQGASGKNGTPNGKKRSLIPAGTLLYGVILNGLNSDNPGPVYGMITGGKFDKSRILGHFTRNGTRMAVQFDKIIYRNGEEDSIQAFAVSPTAKMDNNLATYVNNHDLYRYGMLLGSGFLMGFGEAAMMAGSNMTMTPYGTPYQMFGPSSLQTDGFYGLGMAAQSLQGIAQNAFNTPPTVKVAAGTPIGLLFTGGSGSKLPMSGASKTAPLSNPRQTQPGTMQAGYPGAYPGGYPTPMAAPMAMPMMPMMP